MWMSVAYVLIIVPAMAGPHVAPKFRNRLLAPVAIPITSLLTLNISKLTRETFIRMMPELTITVMPMNWGIPTAVAYFASSSNPMNAMDEPSKAKNFAPIFIMSPPARGAMKSMAIAFGVINKPVSRILFPNPYG